MEEPTDTIAPTVTAPRDASSRLVWGLAAGILVLGLMLLNLESIGRLALGAHGAPRTREPGHGQEERERAVVQVAAGDQAVPPAPATPVAEVVVAPSAGATTTASAASPAPAAPRLERLYPAPVAAPAVRPAATVRPPATPPVSASASAPAVSRPAADGRAGLVMLVRSGALRPASGNDLARWKARYASTNPRPAAAGFDEWTRRMPVYEIVGDMTFPEGLGGANAAVFLLGERAPYPAGDPGHSVILDMASGSCIGVTCGMLLDD